VLIALGLISLVALKTIDVEVEKPKQIVSEYKYKELQYYVAERYNIYPSQAKNIINWAYAYSIYEFPRPYDTLAIIAIESSFKQYAVSSAKAKGLMQILYKPASFDIATNILDGTLLLKEYFDRTRNISSTIQSYNVGITAYTKGTRNKEYLNKFLIEREIFKEKHESILRESKSRTS